ncbi:MAG: bifunctional [glutamine synthetase] adenylyltransferase/[glutamine synthetase]-adenylyl-L-tyrosine phosphorylase [Aquiluna sp.]|nr:bifunctional [glutamine synthetase] adenylyltransferase/[glutamine synthetase]-adenylyl-L-tyrosine phosphorylase [Aquiluna sp.]MCF8545145.1 bifunctional [glutamine synthetase] adenylyltransferase/[glutamine synthetase]-adenylyl-L-tyrosine phosphorylase [Aquiluna sp.]
MSNPRSSSLSELAKLGFESLSHTVAALEELVGHVGDSGRSALSSISKCASPDAALAAIIDLARIDPKLTARLLSKEETADRLARVLGASDGMRDFLLRHPDKIVFSKKPALPKVSALLNLSGATPDELRVSYRMALLQVIDFDLSHENHQAPVKEIMQALSDLASGALEGALAIARAELISEARYSEADIQDTRLAVIGMGKCGARELNYVSDVDVIYVVGGQNPNLIEVGTRLASKLARIIDEPGIEPGLWQVDPNLRPEGKSGALVRTLDAHASYYEKWAEDWEFQALLKARYVAGDSELGKAYEERIKPLIWSRANRAGIVENSRNMRRRVLDLIPASEKDRDIKLGRGGLRDVEFTVQLLQLVHGVTDDSLRVPDTLSALEALSDKGLIGRSEKTAFTSSYLTLRAIEHRVQLTKLRRTHLLPESESELRRIGRGLSQKYSGAQVLELWQKTRLEVAGLHDSVYYRPLLSAMAALSPDEVKLSDQEVFDRLSALGFLDPKGAVGHINALTQGVSRRAAIQRTLLPVLLRFMAEGTAPDRALVAFRRLSEALGETHWFLRMLRDSSGAAERLMRALSSSALISRLLEHIPESTAWLGDSEELLPMRVDEIANEMLAVLERDVANEFSAASIRKIRRREYLRVALSAVLGVTSLEQISAGLTAISDAYLRSMLELAKRKTDIQLDFGIIAMGRWGGSEMGFGSDADAMLVYLDEFEGSQHKAEFLTKELLVLVQDALLEFELDLGLRPEGKNGVTVRSLEGYRGYYQKWADTWEYQALLRARLVTGSSTLVEQFTHLIDGYRYAKSFSQAEIIEVKRIKARVESERLPQGADPLRHLKLGKGAISDVEWLVQLLQLRFANKHESLKTLSTLEALRELSQLGILEQQDEERLRLGWIISSRARSALFLAMDKRIDVLPSDFRELEAAARILEYQPGDAFVLEEDYLSTTRKARSSFEKIFFA